ncbi:hypothetical protein HRU45_02500 [Candidatus Dependentiae bacterium]|nr:hypothetical protein [Candidatus Dependentiae bacterium]
MDIFEPRDRDDIVSEIMVSPSSPSCRPMMVSHSPSYSLDVDVDNHALEQAALLCRKIGKPQMGSFFDVAQDFYRRNNMHPTHPTRARAIRIDEAVDGLDLSSSPRFRDEEENNTALLTLMIEQLSHQHELEKKRLQLEKTIADGAHAEWVADRKTQQKQWVAERKSSNRRFQAAQKQAFKTNVLWGITTVSSLLVGAGSWIWG